MVPGVVLRTLPEVALLTEGVDRNCVSSLPVCWSKPVALLTEGVDRNHTYAGRRVPKYRRPPHGGRG